jgi:hypothetical protein
LQDLSRSAGIGQCSSEQAQTDDTASIKGTDACALMTTAAPSVPQTVRGISVACALRSAIGGFGGLSITADLFVLVWSALPACQSSVSRRASSAIYPVPRHS